MKLTVHQLTKHYGTTRALSCFTYEFEPGIYGILGANGAGKSTLFGLLTDTLRREQGEILWNGTDILKLGRTYRAKVGYMPQGQGYYPQMTAREFLYYMGALKGIPQKALKEEARRLLAEVGLTDVADRKLGQFSGGMRQRALLAQAMLGNPELLILDEPTAGLDPKERIRIRNLISKLGGNKIILLATHIVSDVELIVDQILVMNRGRLCKQGRASELEEALEGKVRLYKLEEAERYVGPNCLAGNIVRRGDEVWMHLVGDELPAGGMQPETVSLDDVYLYWTGDAI